ncbi:MAG: hypothetical protein Q7S87_03540 [Agitococcus sp.]|nr:hypothetical protein [Agitococcus sp.]MDO9177646.1 hypothetical protein [Agitococcus sp.]
MQVVEKTNRVAAIRHYLAGIHHPISQTQAHEVLARALGLKSKHVLASHIEPNQPMPVGEIELATFVPCIGQPEGVQPGGISPEKYTEYSFLIGAFSRESLEGLLEDFGEKFTRHFSSMDLLRARVLELLEKQGVPCFKVEYDNSAYGGDPDCNYVYLPKLLVDSLTFSTTTNAIVAIFNRDPSRALAHVIFYESDEYYSIEGAPFINPEDYA